MPPEKPEGARPGVDSRAFEILVRQHHRRMLGYALALLRQEEAAEEMVQDAFVTAYRNLHKFDPARDFGAWVRGIIRMKHLEWLRRRRMGSLDEALLDSVDDRHAAWDRAVEEGREDALAALRQCLGRLGGLLRRAVDLFYMERQSCAAVADRLGTTEPAVKKRLQRAREMLSECVRQRTGAEEGG